MKRRVVAIYIDDFLPNGQSWIWRQVRNISQVDFIILAHKRSNADRYPFNQVLIPEEHLNLVWEKIKYKMPSIFKLWKPGLQHASADFFRESLVKNQVSVVHAHFGTNGTKIMEICQSMQIPLIVTFHGFDINAVPKRWPGYKEALKKLFREAKVIVAVSGFIKDKLIEAGCMPEKIQISYLGVPEDEFEFEDRRNRSGIFSFLHLGRIVEKKGVPDLIRAFHFAFPDKTNVELRIVGSGEELSDSLKLIEQLNVSNTVIFKSEVSSDEVLPILMNADVFVLNSRVDSQGSTEGLPIALLEAMATGLPVISTLHAGIPEAVIDGETGYLVKERDIASLGDAMRKCLDRQHNFQLGRSGRDLIERKFSLKNCNETLSTLYNTAGR